MMTENISMYRRSPFVTLTTMNKAFFGLQQLRRQSPSSGDLSTIIELMESRLESNLHG